MVEAKDLKNGLSVNILQCGRQINWPQNWHSYLIQTAKDFFKKRLILEKKTYTHNSMMLLRAVLFLTECVHRFSNCADLPAEQSGHFPYLSEAGRGHCTPLRLQTLCRATPQLYLTDKLPTQSSLGSKQGQLQADINQNRTGPSGTKAFETCRSRSSELLTVYLRNALFLVEFASLPLQVWSTGALETKEHMQKWGGVQEEVGSTLIENPLTQVLGKSSFLVLCLLLPTEEVAKPIKSMNNDL